MESFYQERTATTPEIDLNVNGHIKLEGRAIPEDSKKLFKPIFDWLESYTGNKLTLDVNLEYFNTSVSKELLTMFQNIEAMEHVKEILINWHYEEGDDENLESGELYQHALKRSDFNLIEFAEIL